MKELRTKWLLNLEVAENLTSTELMFSSLQFYNEKYSTKGDIILMDFDTQIPRIHGDRLIIKEQNLYWLKSDNLRTTHFYLGYGKGLN